MGKLHCAFNETLRVIYIFSLFLLPVDFSSRIPSQSPLFLRAKSIFSRRYYSTSARIRTRQRPPISSIKRRKRVKFRRITVRLPSTRMNFSHSAATITKTWRKFYLSHKFAIVKGEEGAGLPVPAITMARPCPLNTNKMFALW